MTDDLVSIESDDMGRQAVFLELRPVCPLLLKNRSSVEGLHGALKKLHDVLIRVEPTSGLLGCMDYVLFPLMLVVDSVAPPRRQKLNAGGRSPDSGGGDENLEDSPVPAARSDRVAEAALGEILPLGSIPICMLP